VNNVITDRDSVPVTSTEFIILPPLERRV